MTKARDLSNLLGTNTNGIIDNAKITLDASEIPNLSAAKITSGSMSADRIGSGTFADARISQSSVVAHSPQTDLQPIKSDIYALALREATNESSAAFNLPNQHIDTFATDTLATKTTAGVQSGFVGSIYSATATADAGGTLTDIALSDVNETNGNMALSVTNGNDVGFASNSYNYSAPTHNAILTGNFIFQYTGTSVDYGDRSNVDQYYEFMVLAAGSNYVTGGGSPYNSVDNKGYWAGFSGDNGPRIKFWRGPNTSLGSDSNTPPQTQSCRWARMDGRLYYQINDVTVLTVSESNFNSTANMYGCFAFSAATGVRYIQNVQYRSGMSAIKGLTGDAVSATGTIIQNTNTVGSAKTKVGGTMLYKDNQGTATLGTDLKIYFSCNGGTNWVEASSYSAITPVYSTGIKQVRLGETTCTSGTDVRYKAVWANQASGSKETQLHGIGINY